MNQWYYRDPQNRKIGPLSDQEFEERVIEGEVQPETRVWRSGLADWTTYEALLAHEDKCLMVATGPTERTAPQSSSYSTQIMLGISAIHRPPTGSGISSPSATPPGLRVPAFELCAGCGEEVPSHLFHGIDRQRQCRFCIQQKDAKAYRDRLRQAKGVNSEWIGKFLVRCVLLASVLVLGRFVLFELKNGSDRTILAPTAEAPPGNEPPPGRSLSALPARSR